MLLGLLVTLLWTSSWILFKQAHFPPLTFAGVRYVLAGLLLLPLLLRRREQESLKKLNRRDLALIGLYGVLQIALGNAGQFSALAALPAATVSLVLNLMPPLVAVGGAVLLGERPSARQWAGVGLCLVGVATFFWGRARFTPEQASGLGWATLALVAYAASALVGRALGREGRVTPVALTSLSMLSGASLVLWVGLAVQGPLHPSPAELGILAWLIVVNTALAFSLWNATLAHLTAVESSVLTNVMVAEIALAAWLVLGERLGAGQIAGMTLTVLGALLTQRWSGRNPEA